MNFARFITVSLYVTIAGYVLFMGLVLGFPDRVVPTDPPPTVLEYALRGVAFLVAWPTVVLAFLFGDPRGFGFGLAFLPSGLVWAAIIECLVLWRSRKQRRLGRI